MNSLQLRRSKLSESDLDFVIQEVAPEFKDKPRLKHLILEDEDFRKALVGDEKVFRKVIADEDIILKISPALYFEVLLRNALKDLEKASHTIERAGTQAIPVFDTKEVVGLLSKQLVLNYLADMLASFTKTESYVIPVRVREGIWRKLRFSDIDIDSLTRLCDVVDEEHRLALYKRIADVCLFMLGIFPEYAQFDYRYPFSGKPRPKISLRGRKGMEEYEEEGRKFYKLAGEHPAAKALDLSEAFWLLHENFNTAKKPLNFISDHYLRHRKHTLFKDKSS